MKSLDPILFCILVGILLKLLTPSAFPGPGIVLALPPKHMIETDMGTYALLDEASPATTSITFSKQQLALLTQPEERANNSTDFFPISCTDEPVYYISSVYMVDWPASSLYPQGLQRGIAGFSDSILAR